MDRYQQQTSHVDRSSPSNEWTPNLPHHFASNQDGQPPETLDKLQNLASVAASSDPFQISQTSQAPQPSSLKSGAPSAFLGHNAPHTANPAGPGQSSQQRELLKARRRVPNSQRKRTQTSCDACKTRRCKCVRIKDLSPRDEAAGDGTLPPCKLCTETGIPCVTTMPRKQRVYGSVESLDKRYRALEALVSGLFPALSPKANADELVAFGRRMGVTMPDMGETSGPSHQASSSPSQGVGTAISPWPSPESKQRRDSDLVRASAAYERTMLPQAYAQQGGSNPNSGLVAQPSTNSPSNPESTDGPSSGLILDASGRPHYIGPCGSLAFFTSVRELVSRRLASTDRIPQAGDSQENSGGGSIPHAFRGTLMAGSLGGAQEGRGSSRSSTEPRTSYQRRGRHLEGDSPSRALLRTTSSLVQSTGTDYCRYRKPVSMIELPSRELADTYVDAFFRYVHPNFILFHRATFQRAYEKLWPSWEAHRDGRSGNGETEVSVSIGWLCCLYMMFIFGCRSLPQTRESLEFQRQWFAQVDNLPPLLSTSSLPNVCAFMLLSLYYHNTDDRTSAWTFQGAACRLAIALGMHREKVSASFEPLHREVRKQVWWTMYGYEQFLCCSLGRPSAIDLKEMDVGMPQDGLLDGNLLPDRYLEHASQLYMLLAAIRREIYDPTTVPSRLCARALEFLVPLMAWQKSLPRRLKPVPPEEGLDGNTNQWRTVHMLDVRYQHTVGFLTRPFLLRAVRSMNGGEELGSDAALVTGLGQVCVTSAIRCAKSILELWRAGLINGITWLDIFYAYLSSVTLTLILLSPEALDRHDGISQVLPLLPEAEMIHHHSKQELEDTVRQLCHMMSTVEMCGTSARFAKVATEFAKCVLKVNQESSAPERPSLPEPRTMMVDENPNNALQPTDANIRRGLPDDTGYHGQPELNGIVQGLPVMNNYPTDNLDLDFDGVFDNNADLGLESDMQWDLVLPSSQWNDGGLNTDLNWIWQLPNPNSNPDQ